MALDLDSFLESGALLSLSQNKLWVGWGKSCAVAAENRDLSMPAFYLNDFFLTSTQPWRQYPNWMEIDHETFHSMLQAGEERKQERWSAKHPELFQIAFESLQRLIKVGQLEKGVPYHFVQSSLQMDKIRLCRSLKKGLEASKMRLGYLYGYWDSSHGILGVTPELLFSRGGQKGEEVRTMALAGTCPASQSDQLFLNNLKENREHQFVIDGIKKALDPFGYLQVGEMELLKMPKLTHLMTPIALQLKKAFVFESFVTALHPTPALGTFPRQEGREWLLELERHAPRGYYGAPIGYECPASGRAECIVAIRNVQWNNEEMRIGAGCGVIAESVLEKEWAEVQLKIQSIQEMLDL